MGIDDLRQLPGFMAAWPAIRGPLMEFLFRRQVQMTATNTQETGQQALSKLLLDLERLDESPKPIVPSARPVLNSMKSPNNNSPA